MSSVNREIPVDDNGLDFKNAMENMFHSADAFNQNISSWNVSSVINLGWMFNNAAAFDQVISSRNVSSVTNMGHMFHSADAFNRSIS